MQQGPVVVIGGGIVGCSIALHLADLGAEVMLVDAPAHEAASEASFASISALEKDPLQYYLLASAAMGEWNRWARRLGSEIGLRWGGDVRWASSDAGAERLTALVGTARNRGYPVRDMPESELARFLPGVELGPVRGAAIAALDGYVEPPLVIEACKRELKAAGGRVVDARAEIRLGDDSASVLFDDEKIEPSTAVTAAGAASVEVAAGVGLDLPLVASPGIIVRAVPRAPISQAITHVPGGDDRGIFIRPTIEGHVLVGEGDQETVAHDLSEAYARRLLDEAARYVGELRDVEIARVHLGWRVMPVDRMPILGPMPALPSVYAATMHAGVTMAPTVGRLVAEEIVLGRTSPLLSPFRPGRFAERAREVMAAIDAVFETGS